MARLDQLGSDYAPCLHLPEIPSPLVPFASHSVGQSCLAQLWQAAGSQFNSLHSPPLDSDQCNLTLCSSCPAALVVSHETVRCLGWSGGCPLTTEEPPGCLSKPELRDPVVPNIGSQKTPFLSPTNPWSMDSFPGPRSIQTGASWACTTAA